MRHASEDEQGSVCVALEGVTPGKSGTVSAPLYRFFDRRPYPDAWQVLCDGVQDRWEPGAYALMDGETGEAVLVLCAQEAEVQGPLVWACVSRDVDAWKRTSAETMARDHACMKRAAWWSRWSVPCVALVMAWLAFPMDLFGAGMPWWTLLAIVVVVTGLVVFAVRGGLERRVRSCTTPPWWCARPRGVRHPMGKVLCTWTVWAKAVGWHGTRWRRWMGASRYNGGQDKRV